MVLEIKVESESHKEMTVRQLKQLIEKLPDGMPVKILRDEVSRYVEPEFKIRKLVVYSSSFTGLGYVERFGDSVDAFDALVIE